MTKLNIALFGHATVSHADSLPINLTRGLLAIFAYLVLHQSSVSREVLIDLFWPNQPADRGRNSLATAIWRLRQLLEPGGIAGDHYIVATNSGNIGFNWESDHLLDAKLFDNTVTTFLRKPLAELNEADVRGVVNVLPVYRGELLEGIYDDWALRERERFEMLHSASLMRLLAFYRAKSDYHTAIDYGQQILWKDPLREEVHRDLMHLYAATGQRQLAIRQYNQCRDILDREFGVSPLGETNALYAKICDANIQTASHHPDWTIDGHDYSQLVRDIQRVRRSLDETTQALEQIVKTVHWLASGR